MSSEFKYTEISSKSFKCAVSLSLEIYPSQENINLELQEKSYHMNSILDLLYMCKVTSESSWK